MELNSMKHGRANNESSVEKSVWELQMSVQGKKNPDMQDLQVLPPLGILNHPHATAEDDWRFI